MKTTESKHTKTAKRLGSSREAPAHTKHTSKKEIGMIQVILCGWPPQVTTWGFGILEGQRDRRQKVLMLQLRTSKKTFSSSLGLPHSLAGVGLRKPVRPRLQLQLWRLSSNSSPTALLFFLAKKQTRHTRSDILRDVLFILPTDPFCWAESTWATLVKSLLLLSSELVSGSRLLNHFIKSC